MTLFFNVENLNINSSGDAVRFIALLKAYYNKRLIGSTDTNKLPLHGTSFLLNPLPILTSTMDPLYVVQYIRLAAKRDYALYRLYGTKSIIRSYFPDINLETIKTNPLLEITDSEILFFFE